MEGMRNSADLFEHYQASIILRLPNHLIYARRTGDYFRVFLSLRRLNLNTKERLIGFVGFILVMIGLRSTPGVATGKLRPLPGYRCPAKDLISLSPSLEKRGEGRFCDTRTYGKIPLPPPFTKWELSCQRPMNQNFLEFQIP
jgi:hypothetical protein